MGEQSSPIFRLMLLTKEKASDKVRRSGANKCWASPKGISLSAESDKGVALDLQAFKKARAKLLTVLKSALAKRQSRTA